MQQIDLLNIKLNQIQIFLTLAEVQNFSKAADLLGYTQPMVSRTIRSLEDTLGIILFIRDQRSIRLTPAGQELYHQWKHIIGHIENSIADAHRLQEGHNHILRFGLGTMTMESELDYLKEKVGLLPQDVTVQWEYCLMTRLWEKLKHNQLDLIVISGHTLSADAKETFRWKVLKESCLSVFVPYSNPLSAKDYLSLSDLRGEKFISVSSDVDRNYFLLLNELGAAAGFVPRIACYVENELSLKVNLKMGNGITLADSCTALEDQDIRKFEFPEFRNDLLLVWKRDNGNPELHDLVNLL